MIARVVVRKCIFDTTCLVVLPLIHLLADRKVLPLVGVHNNKNIDTSNDSPLTSPTSRSGSTSSHPGQLPTRQLYPTIPVCGSWNPSHEEYNTPVSTWKSRSVCVMLPSYTWPGIGGEASTLKAPKLFRVERPTLLTTCSFGRNISKWKC